MTLTILYALIIGVYQKLINEGLNERKAEREKEGDNTEKEVKPEKSKARKAKRDPGILMPSSGRRRT